MGMNTHLMTPYMRGFALYFLLFGVFLPAGAQDLERILSDHYAAARYDQLEKVRTITTTGRNIYASGEDESTFTRYLARPSRIRIQSSFRGSLAIQTYNGSEAWIYAPAAGITEPEELKGEELIALNRQAEFESPLWKFREKGYSLEPVAVPADAGTFQLKLTMDDGQVLFFHINRETNLIHSIRSSRIMGGSETEIEVVLLDYERIRGIPMARRVVTRVNGEVVTTMVSERVDLDRNLDPELFEKPVRL